MLSTPVVSATFAWLPIAPEQEQIVRDLYARYIERFRLTPGGTPLAALWLAIVEIKPDGSYGKIGGVVGVNANAAEAVLEVAHLYVYPTRLGARAFRATLEQVCRLYDSGEARKVCCHVVAQNARMTAKVKAIFASRGAREIATLWALGVPKND